MATWHLLPDLPIRIKARGAWLHGDTRLHPRVEALFNRHIVPQADGSYRLQLGQAKAALEVEDTAFFVRRIDIQGTADKIDAVLLTVSDGAQEPLDPTTLAQGEEDALYCGINRHGLRVRCRFLPHDYHVLALHMEEAEEGFALRVGGQAYRVRRL